MKIYGKIRECIIFIIWSYWHKRKNQAGHKQLNKWAEMYGIRNQFHFWTTKRTKRKSIVNTIRKGSG